MDWEICFQFTAREEDGLIDDPADAGGPTKCGLTQHMFDAWLDHCHHPGQEVFLKGWLERCERLRNFSHIFV